MKRRSRREPLASWLDLMDIDGPFLAVPVVKEAWPAGLHTIDGDKVDRLRAADDLLTASPGTRDAFVRGVLEDLLGWADNLTAGPDVPVRLVTHIPEHGATIRPDYALLDEASDPDSPARALVLVIPLQAKPHSRPIGDTHWSATYTDRLAQALRTQNVPIGLVTNGTDWILVGAAHGTATSTAAFNRHVWREEPDTLRAFVNLLGLDRFYGVPDDRTLPALLADSMTRQTEITVALSAQSQAVVEMLVAAIGRLDAAHKSVHGKGVLPEEVEPPQVYEACVTVLMRMVFLLYAEERGLLPADDETYADAYAITTLAERLLQRAGQGEEALERSNEGWQRLLATARAIHRGASHYLLALPAYGGSLFDPDRFPWLEGRQTAEESLAGQDPVGVDDRTLLKALEALQTVIIDGTPQTVSFRVLDVEQIGYVYEGLLDQDARIAADWILGISADTRGVKDGPEIRLADLENWLAEGEDEFSSWLSELCKTNRSKRTPASIKKALNASQPEQAWPRVLEACGGDVDVAQRVLPFHGLLRRDPRDLPVVYPPGSLYLTDSSLRASTGAVYTPRWLAEQVVSQSLEPLVKSPGPLDTEDESQWRLRSPAEILDLKIIDIAAGSGAFLAAATRYLADALIESESEHGVVPAGEKDQEQIILDARRRVVDHCVYGVDINPMAVEMCKLSLWLITLDKARPFGFLDDRIVCGDSLLGLATSDQLTYAHFDPRRGQRLHDPKQTNALGPTLMETLHEASETRARIAEIAMVDTHATVAKSELLRRARTLTSRLSDLADRMSATGLSGGTDNKFKAMLARWYLANANFSSASAGYTASESAEQSSEDLKFSLTATDGRPLRPAHFPLLFPEVFERPNPGFDAVIGNPPFMSGKKISGAYGGNYRNHLARSITMGRPGSPDLVVFMFLRACEILRSGKGQFGLIATKSLAEGSNRRVGLDWMVHNGVDIRASIKSRPWETGAANLSYCVVWGSLAPRAEGVRAKCDGQLVRLIGSDLLPAIEGDSRQRLRVNSGKSFYGTVISGKGFILTSAEAEELIAAEPEAAEVIDRYLTGGDLLEAPDCRAQRFVINFRDWSFERSKATAPLALERVRRLVKPERDRVERESYRKKWWQFAERCAELYRATAHLDQVLTVPQTGTYLPFIFSENGQVFAQSVTVFTLEGPAFAGILNSTFHQTWVDKTSGTLDTRPTYRSTDSFLTFVMPEDLDTLARPSVALLESWRMGALEFGGMTEFLNHVHGPSESHPLVHEARERLKDVDVAVARAYGWNDLALRHDHFQTRHGLRWTLPVEVREQVLMRLFSLNAKAHRAEPSVKKTRSSLASRVQESLFGEEL